MRTSRWTTLALLSPFLVGLALFVVYPVVTTLYYSFTDMQVGSYRPVRWVGLANYRELFTGSDSFWISVQNTLWVVLIMVPVQTVWAIATATVLTRARSFYRTLFFLPSMVPTVAASLGFVILLGPGGPLDHLLGLAGISGPGWFNDPGWSKPGLTLMAMWTIGNTMVIFLAALLEVPRSLYEAAAIDGAGFVQQFRRITLPMISPVILFSLVTDMIYAFQYFTEAFVASSSASSTSSSGESVGYPAQSLLFYSSELYQQAFGYFRTGYASAMAWLLFLVILACTAVLLRSSGRWVHYGGGHR